MPSIRERLDAAKKARVENTRQREADVEEKAKLRRKQELSREQKEQDERKQKQTTWDRYSQHLKESGIYGRIVALESDTLEVCQALLDDIEDRYGEKSVNIFRKFSLTRRPNLKPSVSFLPSLQKWVDEKALNTQDVRLLFTNQSQFNAHLGEYLDSKTTQANFTGDTFRDFESTVLQSPKGFELFEVNLPVETVSKAPGYRSYLNRGSSSGHITSAWLSLRLSLPPGLSDNYFEQYVAPVYETFINEGLATISRPIGDEQGGYVFDATWYRSEYQGGP